MIIFKEFTFDAAHKLPDYKGACANLHGHTYKCQIGIDGNIKPNAMIMDFKEINKIINRICNTYDHTYLNDLNVNPTAESLALDIFHLAEEWLIEQELDEQVSVVRLWETPTSWVEVKREDYEGM